MTQAAKRFQTSLLAARLQADLTQQEAADVIGISQPLWCDYERGRKEPGIEMARRMAEAVGVTLAALFI